MQNYKARAYVISMEFLAKIADPSHETLLGRERRRTAVFAGYLLNYFVFQLL